MEPGTCWPLGAVMSLPAVIFISPSRATPAKLKLTCPEAARAEAVRAVSASAVAAPARNDGNRYFMEILPFCVSVFQGTGPRPFYLLNAPGACSVPRDVNFCRKRQN